MKKEDLLSQVLSIVIYLSPYFFTGIFFLVFSLLENGAIENCTDSLAYYTRDTYAVWSYIDIILVILSFIGVYSAKRIFTPLFDLIKSKSIRFILSVLVMGFFYTLYVYFPVFIDHQAYLSRNRELIGISQKIKSNKVLKVDLSINSTGYYDQTWSNRDYKILTVEQKITAKSTDGIELPISQLRPRLYVSNLFNDISSMFISNNDDEFNTEDEKYNGFKMIISKSNPNMFYIVNKHDKLVDFNLNEIKKEY